MNGESLQERFAPQGRCFGCGPANAGGLRIRSFEADDGSVIAEFQPRPEHEAFDGFVNGGILGVLIDCHSNWAGVAAIMARTGEASARSTVTSEFAVRFLRPTPSDRSLRVIARAVEVSDRHVTVEASIEVDGEVTATGGGTFVTVKQGHPAYGRW